MAPRGAKRAAQEKAPEDPDAKRIKSFLKEQGVSNTSFSALVDIVEHPLAGLNDDCRQMLKAIIPWSICVPSDARGESQAACINMLIEVHEKVQQGMQEAIDAETSKVAEVEESGLTFEERMKEAEERSAETKTIVEERTKALAEASESLFAARTAVTDAKVEQTRGDADIKKIQADQTEFGEALNNCMKSLKAGDWKDEEGPQILKALTKAVNKLTLEESLKTALMNGGLKRERGPFDVMVLDQVEEALQSKMSELAEQAAPLAGASEERAAKVQAAESELESMTATQREAAAELSRAQATHRESMELVKTITREKGTFEPTLAKAKEVLAKTEEELQSFRDFNVQIFNMFLDRTLKPKDMETTEVDETAAPEGGA